MQIKFPHIYQTATNKDIDDINVELKISRKFTHKPGKERGGETGNVLHTCGHGLKNLKKDGPFLTLLHVCQPNEVHIHEDLVNFLTQ